MCECVCTRACMCVRLGMGGKMKEGLWENMGAMGSVSTHDQEGDPQLVSHEVAAALAGACSFSLQEFQHQLACPSSGFRKGHRCFSGTTFPVPSQL